MLPVLSGLLKTAAFWEKAQARARWLCQRQLELQRCLASVNAVCGQTQDEMCWSHAGCSPLACPTPLFSVLRPDGGPGAAYGQPH